MSLFPNAYRVLNNKEVASGNYKIVPIRYEDRMDIMKWRNEQIYHLRQKEPLTKEDQDRYFQNVISKLFEQEQPDQLLFSYLENNLCIGYGGLVHINWIDKNAEISFIMDTALEEEYFKKHWLVFLQLIENVAFYELKLHKIYTFAFDLRPHLYEAVEAAGFYKEAVLKEHCYFQGAFKSVIIHSKINQGIFIRRANERDVEITYNWANDEETRKNSFSSKPILFHDHQIWWLSRMQDENAIYYICELNTTPVGIVRFDKDSQCDNFIIGITVAPEYRGKGLSGKLLSMACSEFFKSHGGGIDAYIKKENTASIKAFENAGFVFVENVWVGGIDSLKYQLINER